jgi:hypothetical protein
VSRDLSHSASSRDDDLPSPGALKSSMTSETTSSKNEKGGVGQWMEMPVVRPRPE